LQLILCFCLKCNHFAGNIFFPLYLKKWFYILFFRVSQHFRAKWTQFKLLPMMVGIGGLCFCVCILLANYGLQLEQRILDAEADGQEAGKRVTVAEPVVAPTTKEKEVVVPIGKTDDVATSSVSLQNIIENAGKTINNGSIEKEDKAVGPSSPVVGPAVGASVAVGSKVTDVAGQNEKGVLRIATSALVFSVVFHAIGAFSNSFVLHEHTIVFTCLQACTFGLLIQVCTLL
jgi:hypothetical protein